MSSILCVIDIDGWAFAKIGQALQKYSVNKVDVERFSKLHKKDLNSYDLIFSLVDFRPLQHFSDWKINPKKLLLGIRQDIFVRGCVKEFYDNEKLMRELCPNGFVCSNELIASKFRTLNQTAYVFEGGVDHELFFPKPNDSLHSPIMVSWAGSRDHFTEFRHFDVIQKACDICGYIYNPGYREIQRRTEIEMAGFHREVYDIYCELDERSGRANGLLESLSTGKLCMALKGVGVNDKLIEHKVNGLLVDGSLRSVVKGMRRLVDHPEYRVKARQTVIDEWTWESHIDGLDNIFKEVIDKR